MSLWRGSGYQEGFMHAFHFLFGFGAAIAPMLIGLLLKQEVAALAGWYMVGGMFFPGAIAFLALSRGPQPPMVQDVEESSAAGATASIVILTGAFLFVYVGIEVAFGGYIDLFVVRWLGASEVQGAGLTSVYWIALSISRGVAAAVTSFVHHARYLVWHLLLGIFSITALCVMTVGGSDAAPVSPIEHWTVVLSTFLFGFALGPLFPGALLVAEELNAGKSLPERDTGRIVGAAAAGEMSLPLLVGWLFSLSPWNFCLAQLALCLGTAVIFLSNSRGLL